jgi:hypothetical protein
MSELASCSSIDSYFSWIKSVYLVSILGMSVAGFIVDSRYTRYILHSYAVMLGLQLIDHIAYTKFSFVMMLYSCVEEMIFLRKGGSKLFPFLFFNYTGLVISFHVSVLLDITSFSRLAESMQLSILQFFCINLFVHILPLAVAASFAFTHMWCSGTVTAGIHLSWAVFTAQGLNLSSVYVHMKSWQWYTMWVSAVAGHFVSCIFFFFEPNRRWNCRIGKK